MDIPLHIITHGCSYLDPSYMRELPNQSRGVCTMCGSGSTLLPVGCAGEGLCLSSLCQGPSGFSI